jgi:superkiller protein 3
LRADPDDHQTWLRLGEAYHKAGRHTAAVRALYRSHELAPNNWVCSYVIAQVQQEMGQLDEAIDLYSSILRERPDEIGVMLSLAQARLDLGISENARGFFARSESSFLSTIEDGLVAMQSGEGFRSVAWKVVCDAISWLSRSTLYEDTARALAVISTVVSYIDADPALRDILPLQLIPEESILFGKDASAIAVAAYNFRLSLIPPEHPSTSSGWHDLAAALIVWQARALDGEQKDKALKLAAETITKALRQDPGNDLSWNILGLAYFPSHAKAAQHSFIKALEIDSKV